MLSARQLLKFNDTQLSGWWKKLNCERMEESKLENEKLWKIMEKF